MLVTRQRIDRKLWVNVDLRIREKTINHYEKRERMTTLFGYEDDASNCQTTGDLLGFL